MPLRVRLVAAVLVLVTAALVLISVASTLALHYYLLGRLDQVNREVASTLVAKNQPAGVVYLPSDFFWMRSSSDGIGVVSYSYNLTEDDLPPLVTGWDRIEAQQGIPYTVRSVNRQEKWRMLVTVSRSGTVHHVGQNMSDLNLAVQRLVWIDLMVGGAVLVVLASVGAAIVRSSLRPLTEIELTAAAIAAGDLTRRIPDPQPGADQHQNELARLSRALNAMLTQIEAAFIARATSESAALAAESAARDAAVAAQASEARALRSEQRMRQFVADASHELRTPLTTIRGFAELYRQGAAGNPEDAAKLVRRVEDEAARMGLLVEDLLLLARLDRERPLVLAPVELPVLAMDAVQAARATAPDRRIDLEIDDDAATLVGYGDDARLRQVIGNLMTNALTHTPPTALITLRLRAEAGHRARLEVADTGPGLTLEQTERVFERFYRADAARTRHATTGTGLGLAIVAAIVAAHHGSVEVDSKPGAGATFRVRLPLVPPGEPVAS
jgi:two-component system OmpR family sensor kinase